MVKPELLEAILKNLVAQYSDQTCVETMLIDIVEILKNRTKSGREQYNQLAEKDSYLLELIESDEQIVNVLNNALDELNY